MANRLTPMSEHCLCKGPAKKRTNLHGMQTLNPCTTLQASVPSQVVEGALRFTWEFKRATGFAPSGFGCYFVKREGARAKLLAGAYRCRVPPTCARRAGVLTQALLADPGPGVVHVHACARSGLQASTCVVR